jgi:hypothetical protein
MQGRLEVAMAGRYRTYWIVRRRYRVAGYVGSIVSLLIAAFYLVPLVHGADASGAAGPPGDPLETLGLLALAAVIPPVVARLLWRVHRRRFLDDMYPLSIV